MGRYILVWRLVILCAFVWAPFLAAGHQKAPDGEYKAISKRIDSLVNPRFLRGNDAATVAGKSQRAVKMYLALTQKYRLLTTDMMAFFYTSIAAKDAAAFYTAGRMIILNSGDPISNFLEGEDTSFLAQPAFAASVKKIRKEEPVLLKQAHMSLDWKWNMQISGLVKSNFDFRRIPPQYFKDTLSWYMAMRTMDSIHMNQFCSLVKEQGFPSMSRVGVNAATLQGVIKHFSGMVGLQDDGFFIDRWKFLMPYMLNAASAGEMEPKFYCYISNEVVAGLRKDEDIKYFQQFQCK